MAIEQNSLGEYVISLLKEGQDREQIATHLLEKGHDEKFVHELVAETTKLYNAKRSSAGLTLVLTGAIICLLSFLLTLTETGTQHNLALVLYGLTSVGIIIAFTGFMKIF